MNEYNTTLQNAIELQEMTVDLLDKIEESSTFDRVILSFLKELREYRKTGKTPEELQSMSCENCIGKDQCTIHENHYIKYCSDWVWKPELIVPMDKMKEILDKSIGGEADEQG